MPSFVRKFGWCDHVGALRDEALRKNSVQFLPDFFLFVSLCKNSWTRTFWFQMIAKVARSACKNNLRPSACPTMTGGGDPNGIRSLTSSFVLLRDSAAIT